MPIPVPSPPALFHRAQTTALSDTGGIVGTSTTSKFLSDPFAMLARHQREN